MSDSIPELSIVMPCLNEAATIDLCIKKAQSFLRAYKIEGAIIVADNGSTDSSVEIAQKLGVRVISIGEKGYGAALAGGITLARGKFVIMGDADNSYDFSDLMPILKKLREGTDLVVGNRFKGGIKTGAMPFLNRYLGNPVLSFIGRLFFKIPIHDFHCGLRGFSREKIVSLDLQTTGMEYASEMIVRAALYGLSMSEIPVTLSPDGRGHKSHLEPWHDGWRHLRFLFLYSPRWLYFYPGLAMLVLGLLISALLLPGPMIIGGGVGLDVHSLLVGAASILLGTQTITFGLIARSYARRNGILPSKSRYDKILTSIKLEHLLMLSGVLLFCGLLAFSIAMYRWADVHFGALDYRDVMRLLIFSVTCTISGFQVGFAGFLLGVMQIRQK